MRSRNNNSSSGVTLIELLVAMVVSGVVISGAFMLFVNVSKGFWFHKNNAEKVREMVVAKKKIESAIATLGKVETFTSNSFSAWSTNGDSLIDVRMTGDTLYASKKPIAGGLSTFTVQIIQKNATTQNSIAILQWEAEMKKGGGWIGGSRAVCK